MVYRSLVVFTILIFAFSLGWMSQTVTKSMNRRVTLPSTATYVFPKGLEQVILPSTQECLAFNIGDRIDVLIDDCGATKPIVLDAVVSTRTPAFFVIAVPDGADAAVKTAYLMKRRIFFRTSISPSNFAYEFKPGSEPHVPNAPSFP
ncbi:MAG: hypothetical protein SGI77_10150 [Pirellulaceae bacterium]|nr:hypothetical protein [Pirellulaceae bacterium]